MHLDSRVSGLAAAVVGAESPESTRPEAESTRETSVDPLVPDWKWGMRGWGTQVYTVQGGVGLGRGGYCQGVVRELGKLPGKMVPCGPVQSGPRLGDPSLPNPHTNIGFQADTYIIKLFSVFKIDRSDLLYTKLDKVAPLVRDPPQADSSPFAKSTHLLNQPLHQS